MSNNLIDSYMTYPSTLVDSIAYLVDGFWREMGDFRVHSRYPLMSGGPGPIVAIVCLYVLFIRGIGPKMMKNRQPYDLKWPIRVYNIAMTLVNAYTFYRVAVLTRCGIDYFGCKQVDRSGKTKAENELVQIAFIYFSSKIVELLDTIFFVLRKKYNQASNLHVFHHGFIAICVWIYFKIAPGGSSVLFPFLNTGVHTIMYGYYFLATYPSLQKYLWWKKYLTLIQIIQFIMSMVHFSFQGLSSCDYPPALAVIGFSFNFVFLVLFIDFYTRSYISNKRQQPSMATSNNQSRQSSTKILKQPPQDIDTVINKNHPSRTQLVRRQTCSPTTTEQQTIISTKYRPIELVVPPY